MFTDIHSHIVYGIDDGARTLDEAEELVVTDIREGAERIISTSHYYVDAPSDPDIIHERLDELRERLHRLATAMQMMTMSLQNSHRMQIVNLPPRKLHLGRPSGSSPAMKSSISTAWSSDLTEARF